MNLFDGIINRKPVYANKDFRNTTDTFGSASNFFGTPQTNTSINKQYAPSTAPTVQKKMSYQMPGYKASVESRFNAPTEGAFYKAVSPYEQTAQMATESMQDTTKMYQQKAQDISQWGQDIAKKPGFEKLGQMVKVKFPEYNDLTDADLGMKWLKKFPEYADIVEGEAQTTIGQGAKFLGGVGSMAVNAPGMVTGGTEQLGTGLGTIASAQSGQDVVEGALQAGKGAFTAGFGVATGAMPIASTIFGGATGFDTVQQGLGYLGQKAGDLSAGTAGLLGGNKQVQEQARGFGEVALPALALGGVSKSGKVIKPVAQATGKAIVRGAKMVAPRVVQPVKNLGSTIGQKYKGARQYLSGLDEREISAIEKASAGEMDSIIRQAKETQGKQGDYVQTPYHVGAEKAKKTLSQLDKDLKTRQSERLSVLNEAPIVKIDANEARMALKSSLRSMNVEDIRIIDGKPEIIPVKGREALLDLSNPADVKALQKLNEILDGDVSPTQTMDRVKKLQEWAYENKSTIGVKGTSERMDGLIKRVQGSLNATFKKQLPKEYATILDSMSEDIKLSNEVKRVFGIDDNGALVGNRGEMVMKRLANGTTTGGEARQIAKQIFDRYGIDLVKEARLRQMAMDLVGDTRGQTLFGAIQKGKSGIMDLAIQKTLGKIVNKEGVVRSLAKGKGEIVKKTKPIYTPNPFRKAMAEEIRKPLALPPASGKASGAKNFRVNQPTDTQKVITDKVNTDKVKRPTTAGVTESEVVKMKKAQDKSRTIEDIKNTIASNTKSARYGGTGNTRIESGIESAILQKKITRDEAKDILMDIFDDVNSGSSKYSYIDKKQLENYINDFFKGKKIEDFDEMVKYPTKTTVDLTKSKGGFIKLPGGNKPIVKKGQDIAGDMETNKLIEEARRFKTADEFIKANKLYHGTSKEKYDNILKTGFKTPRELAKDGRFEVMMMEDHVSFTGDKKVAERYALRDKNGGKLVEIDKSNLKLLNDKTNRWKDGEEWIDYIKRLEKEGFDGIDGSLGHPDFKDYYQPPGKSGDTEVLIWNTKKIKEMTKETESQLRKIYEQSKK